MKIFIDTANLDAIKEYVALGIVDGVTTNPSLVAKENVSHERRIKEIAEIVEGPISVEVTTVNADEMYEEAKVLASWAPNTVIKLPITRDGLKTTYRLSQEGIPTNLTLIFSSTQALLAARAGASYVSPFVGRLDDISHDGMAGVAEIVQMFSQYPTLETEVIVASVRHPLHVIEAATMGADIATIPGKVLDQMLHHPLTDKGLAQFMEDAKAYRDK